jgi:tetratricopeptide (TPR) repeat protein
MRFVVMAPVVVVIAAVFALAPVARAAPYEFAAPPFALSQAAVGALGGAEAEYKAMPANPRSVAAYATLLKAQGKVTEALEVAQKCSEPGCAFLLAILLADTDRAAEAEKHVRSFIAAAEGKDKVLALITAGKAALARGDADAAMADFQAALQAEPSARVARLWQAYTLVYAGKHAEAGKILDGELASMTSGEVMLFRGRVYEATGRVGDVKRAYQAAFDGLSKDVVTSPEVSWQHLFLAAAADKVGRADVAKVHRRVAKQLLVTHEIYVKAKAK